jgi:hypothetical protein
VAHSSIVRPSPSVTEAYTSTWRTALENWPEKRATSRSSNCSSKSFLRKVGSMFLRVNSRCAHHGAHHGGLECAVPAARIRRDTKMEWNANRRRMSSILCGSPYWTIFNPGSSVTPLERSGFAKRRSFSFVLVSPSLFTTAPIGRVASVGPRGPVVDAHRDNRRTASRRVSVLMSNIDNIRYDV